MLEDYKLSLNVRRLSNIGTGEPFLDSVLKLGLPATHVHVQVERVTTFDGLSLATYRAKEHYRDSITIKKGGAVRRGAGRALGTIAEESLDAIGKLYGIGSAMQLKRIVSLIVQKARLVQENETERFNPHLALYGQNVGKASYIVRTYRALTAPTSVVRDVIPEDEVRGSLGKPTLITSAKVALDLTNAPTTKNDRLAHVRLREDYDIGSLLPSHRRPVEINQWHKTMIRTLDENGEKRETEIHRGSQVLNLGPVEYRVIATGKKS